MLRERFTTKFPFPHPVNETTARLVAAGVVIGGVTYLATNILWLLLALTYGFIARVCAGPALSPLGLLASKIITPLVRIDHKFVPGPPKRFAQLIGSFMTVTATALTLTGYTFAGKVAIAVLVFAAALEASLGICLGCMIFKTLIKARIIPKATCLRCAQN